MPSSSLLGEALGDWHWVNTEMHVETKLNQVWRGTWRPRDRVHSELHLEVVIERDWSGTLSWRLSEAVIECVGRYTWRPWSNKIGGVLGGGWSGSDWSEGGQSAGSQSVSSESAGSESAGSESAGSRSGGLCNGCWESINWLIHNCGNVENWVQQGSLRVQRLAGSGRQSLSGWYSTQRTSAKCILVTGSQQECLRGCGV